MRNRCCYWAELLTSSSGELTALAKLAERLGFEPHGTEGRILSPSSDYLLRIDWLSCLIGALLW